MFISFPAIIFQWVELRSLASSLKIMCLAINVSQSIAKPVVVRQPYFTENSIK